MIETFCRDCGGRYPLGQDHVCPKKPAAKKMGGTGAHATKVAQNRPGRCRAKKSTAARMDVLTNRLGRAGSTPASSTTAGDMGESEARPTAGTQAPPVDFLVKDYLVPGTEVINTNLDLTKRGTPRKRAPKGSFDRKANHREFMRKSRAAKAAKETK